MADNTILPTSDAGGDTLRTEDHGGGGIKTPVSLIDVGGTGASEAIVGDAGVGMPVEGLAAENAAVVGSPILVGGRYDLSARTLGDGDVGAIALDADGAVQISDGGNTITVDGSVSLTGNLPDTASGDLAAINSALAGTLTVASHAVTNAGTFAVQEDGAALTALQLIDNGVYVDDADWTALSSSHYLIGGIYQSTPGTITDGDTGPLRLSANGAVHIHDGGNTITVDGTVTANLSATDNAVLDSIDTAVNGTLTVGASNDGSLNVQIGDGTNTATIRNLASNDALNVSIVDGSGNQVTSFGGSGGTSATDDSTFTAASGSGTPIMGFFSTDTVDANDVGVLAMDASRRLLVSIEADNAGIGGGTQYAVDAALGSTPTGTLAVGIRDDALSALTPVEGDAVGLRVDANGALWVIPSGTTTVDNAGTFAVQAAQSGTWNINNVSGTVSLPTGAATAAKQPALGTAGTASSDVITVQGIASMTALVVDGSGVTQPVSGTVTANLSATDNAVLDTIEANTSGNTSHYRNIDANAEDAIKGSAGTLKWLHAINTTNALAYLHLYDATTASVTPGTTTPDYTFPIPTTGTASQGAGFVLPAQIEFTNAITLVVTTTVDGSTGDPGTNGVFVNAGYE